MNNQTKSWTKIVNFTLMLILIITFHLCDFNNLVKPIITIYYEYDFYLNMLEVICINISLFDWFVTCSSNLNTI